MLSSNLFGLDGKTVLVTGASSGIGRASAIRCSQSGAQVILFGRNTDRLKQTLNAMDRPQDHQFFSFDLRDQKSMKKVLEEMGRTTEKIHGLIHSAGISTTLPLRMVKPESLTDFFNTNVVPAIYLTRLVTRKTWSPSEGSSIVFISSVMGSVGEAGKTVYGLTKGALIAASRSMALELAPRKIRVNCISPGVVDTPMTQAAVYSRQKEAREQIERLHPLGIGQPDDIAHACVFLLSDSARWITGANLFVDGGYTAR